MALTPEVARRRFVVISTLGTLPLGLTMATMILLMAARGLDLPTIGVVAVVNGLVIAGLELPTGGLADVLGRRGVLAAAAAAGTVALVWMAFATTGWEFVVIAVLRGVSRALGSGPAQAWYVDTVQVADPEAPIRAGLSQAAAAGSVALGMGVLVGGGLPLVVPLSEHGWLIPLAVPMLLAAAAYAALLLVTLTQMREPPRTGARPGLRKTVRDVPATVTDGARLGIGDRTLAPLLATVAANGIALAAVELLTPGRFADLTGGATTAAMGYAVVATVGFAGSAAGASLSPWLTSVLGSPRRTAIVGTLIAGGSLTGMATTGGLTGTAGLVAVGSGYAGMFLGMGLATPARLELMHGRVTASTRATMLSILSLTLHGGGAIGNYGLAWLAATWTIPGAWLTAGLVFLASTVLIQRIPHSPEPAAYPTARTSTRHAASDTGEGEPGP